MQRTVFDNEKNDNDWEPDSHASYFKSAETWKNHD